MTSEPNWSFGKSQKLQDLENTVAAGWWNLILHQKIVVLSECMTQISPIICHTDKISSQNALQHSARDESFISSPVVTHRFDVRTFDCVNFGHIFAAA